MTDVQICPPGGAPSLERTRFYGGQIVTPDDLTQDQRWIRDKLRRHNRMLHGWGVVCGARVRTGAKASEVIVEHGYVLGPFGDEIVIDRDVTVDVCHEGLDASDACIDSSDPWCADVRINRQQGQVLYLAVRYAECDTRPVRTYAGLCGCDEAGCEYSRTRDTFALRLLTQLPATYDPMDSSRDFVSVISGDLPSTPAGVLVPEPCGRPCPPCPTEPWVILADISVGQDCSVLGIDCCTHRRNVVSFAEYYFLCRHGHQ
jgi:hypothetical protein